jgi:hypothetical protein
MNKNIMVWEQKYAKAWQARLPLGYNNFSKEDLERGEILRIRRRKVL